MAIALQQNPVSNTSGGTTQLVVTPSAFVNGNGIVVCVASTSRGPSSVTDNNSVALTQIRTANFFSSPFSNIYWISACSGSPTSINVNFGSSTICRATVYEVIGSLTANAGNAANANTTTPAAGAITTTVADTIAFACCQSASSMNSQPSGYTSDLAGAASGYGMAHLVYTSIQTAINPTWGTGSGGSATTIEAFTSSVTTQAEYLPIGPRGMLLPVDMPVDAAPVPRNGFVLPGTTVNTSTWLPKAMIVVPEIPRFGPPPAPPVNAWLLPQTNNSPSDFHPRPRPAEPVPLPAVAVTPRTSAILFPGFVSPPDVFHRIHSLDLLERSPVGADPRRVARITDKLSQRINSLVRRGEMFRIDNDEWTLRGGARSVARNPASFDDTASGVVIGQLWVNSVTKKLWVCVDATKAAAVWIGPLG